MWILIDPSFRIDPEFKELDNWKEASKQKLSHFENILSFWKLFQNTSMLMISNVSYDLTKEMHKITLINQQWHNVDALYYISLSVTTRYAISS